MCLFRHGRIGAHQEAMEVLEREKLEEVKVTEPDSRLMKDNRDCPARERCTAGDARTVGRDGREPLLEAMEWRV